MFDSVGKDEYTQRVIKDIKPTFFKEQDLKTSLWFLQGYCCEEITKNESCKAIKQQKKFYPESAILFDQLVYVGMMKLDGDQDTCDSLNIACYPKAKARREKIRSIAESREWVPPSQIILEFSGAWWWAANDFLDVNNGLLSSAYTQMCAEAEAIYTKIGYSQSTTASLQDKAADGKLVGVTRSQRCRHLVQQRFQQEIFYIKSLQVEKGMKYYVDNINSYINTYFFQNRGMTLLDTIQEINSCFTPVLRLVQRTVNCCVSGKE
jgi:hypothetical protein